MDMKKILIVSITGLGFIGACSGIFLFNGNNSLGNPNLPKTVEAKPLLEKTKHDQKPNFPNKDVFAEYQGDNNHKVFKSDGQTLPIWMNKKEIKKEICGGKYSNCIKSDDGFYIQNKETGMTLFRSGNMNVYDNNGEFIPQAFLTEKGYDFCNNNFKNCDITEEGILNINTGEILNFAQVS